MPSARYINVAGGGLAGLTLGIGLRQRGVPVTIWEAGDYPRHRVCGEFICGRGLQTLSRLGLIPKIEQRGARVANTAAFFNRHASFEIHKLPSEALCVSRFVLDETLALQFQRLGGELRTHQRWQGKKAQEGVVWATGRRVRTGESSSRWFGLKIHARGVELQADLEMHLSPHGYVGLCRLANDEVNVCGLFRRGLHARAKNARELLRGEPGSALNERLAAADFEDPSFCSIAGLNLRSDRLRNQPECRIGDTITMIPPVTGNGMSMAFESAEMAIEPLMEYVWGRTSWLQARQTIARECDSQFARRLFWARWLQAFVLSPWCQRTLIRPVAKSETLWRAWFALTR